MPSVAGRTAESTSSSIATTNPATGERVIGFEAHSAEQVERAIRDADAVYARWRERSVAERAAIVGRAGELMLERIDELAPLLTLEMGKRIEEAEGEVQLAASIFAYYAEHGERMLAPDTVPTDAGDAQLLHEPIGVLLGIMPWNFPYYQVARFAAPNLVAGNVILLKHASICPQSAMALETVLADAGLPAHTYANLLVPSDQIEGIIRDDRVRGVSLTGSESAGAAVAEVAGAELKKVVLELGGSDPFIVLDDADVDAAVATAVEGRMANVGQACTASKRLIVLDALYDDFVERLVAKLREFEPGDPAERDTTLAPLSSERALEDLLEQVRDTIEDGATCLLGGERIDRDGWYMQPTVLVDVEPGMRAYADELFGPVAVVHRVADEDAAVALANDSEFGLGGTVFTSDTERGTKLARRIDTGMVWINAPTTSRPELPFGGTKRSGVGRELGELGIREFCNHKLVFAPDPEQVD